MAQSFTDQKISQVYNSILHTDGTLTNMQNAIYDGVGNQSTIFLSTTGCSLSGNVSIRGVDFNIDSSTIGLLSANAGYLVNVASTDIIRPKTTTFTLSTVTVSVSTGDIVYDGIIPSINSFWNTLTRPVSGDIVITLQKYYFISPTTDTKFIRDIKINNYSYNGIVWNYTSSPEP